jgi:electron transport complex protein RnfE
VAGCHDLETLTAEAAKHEGAKDDLVNGLYKESPLLRQLLGLCSTLAITTTLFSALAMGAAVTVTLIICSVVVSLMREVIPEDVRLPMKIVVIATTVTVVEQTMHAFTPEAWKVLGVYLPLIVVNCIILGRAEAFAHAHGPWRSAADALGQGLGYSVILAILGLVREILGNGTLMGVSLFGKGFEPIILMAMPGGAFFLMGIILGTVSWIDHRRERAARAREAACVPSLATEGEVA